MVRHFLHTHAPQAVPPQGFFGWTEADLRWQRLLIDQGYVGRTIPVAYGGKGEAAKLLRDEIVAEEFEARGLSKGLPGQGITYVIPTLLEIGSPEQRATLNRPTLHGELIWCQDYSEPGLGSDMASVQTRGVDEGDDFVITPCILKLDAGGSSCGWSPGMPGANRSC